MRSAALFVVLSAAGLVLHAQGAPIPAKKPPKPIDWTGKWSCTWWSTQGTMSFAKGGGYLHAHGDQKFHGSWKIKDNQLQVSEWWQKDDGTWGEEMKWTAKLPLKVEKGKPVELELDGQYHGTLVLIEKVEAR